MYVGRIGVPMIRELKRSLCLGFFSLLMTATLCAQGTDLGTIRGSITDASGAVIPKAAVEVTDLATNTSRKLTTDGEGNYEAAGLRAGAYKVMVTVTGFSSAEITGISLRGGEMVRADAKMRPAGANQTVVITSEAALIETDSPTIGSTLDNREITELPRDSRDIYSFLYLNPNISQGS